MENQSNKNDNMHSDFVVSSWMSVFPALLSHRVSVSVTPVLVHHAMHLSLKLVIVGKQSKRSSVVKQHPNVTRYVRKRSTAGNMTARLCVTRDRVNHAA